MEDKLLKKAAPGLLTNLLGIPALIASVASKAYFRNIWLKLKQQCSGNPRLLKNLANALVCFMLLLVVVAVRRTAAQVDRRRVFAERRRKIFEGVRDWDSHSEYLEDDVYSDCNRHHKRDVVVRINNDDDTYELI